MLHNLVNVENAGMAAGLYLQERRADDGIQHQRLQFADLDALTDFSFAKVISGYVYKEWI